ncbi:MAG: DUF996 domain-containing protein [Candidatus Bathyarchaeia archaeon]
MSLESSKALGFVGAILMVISFIGVVGRLYEGLPLLAGIILVLIALKGFADHYKEKGIFNNSLYGTITVIVGIVAAILIFIILILPIAPQLKELDWTNTAAVQVFVRENLRFLLGPILGAYLMLVISLIISALFFRKSLDALSAKSGEKMFETAGLIWLIGAVLSIILIGFIIMWIAWILMAVGFFSMKTSSIQQENPPPSPQ